MKYTIMLKDKKNAFMEIDSVKSIADSSLLTFYLKKNESCCDEITFVVTLLPPAKCTTCGGAVPIQADLTKGVIMYYQREGKKYIQPVSKFKRLKDKLIP